MKNRVTVTIAGQEYTLVGTEEASYTCLLYTSPSPRD